MVVVGWTCSGADFPQSGRWSLWNTDWTNSFRSNRISPPRSRLRASCSARPPSPSRSVPSAPQRRRLNDCGTSPGPHRHTWWLGAKTPRFAAGVPGVRAPPAFVRRSIYYLSGDGRRIKSVAVDAILDKWPTLACQGSRCPGPSPRQVSARLSDILKSFPSLVFDFRHVTRRLGPFIHICARGV